MQTKQLITHRSFSKIMIDDACFARIDKLVDGTWRRTQGASIEVGTAEHAAQWLTALSLAVTLS